MSLLSLKDESIAHCAGGGAGVQNIFLEDVMSLKSAIGEYGNPFLKPIATFSFSTHVTLYRNMLSTMSMESSPMDVNSTTIYMGTAIREYELYY